MKLATRSLLFILLAAIPLWPETDPCAVQIIIGDHKSLTVTFPCMDRPQLVDLVSTFFGKGDDAAKKRFQDVLKNSGDITMKLTTERPR